MNSKIIVAKLNYLFEKYFMSTLCSNLIWSCLGHHVT